MNAKTFKNTSLGEFLDLLYVEGINHKFVPPDKNSSDLIDLNGIFRIYTKYHIISFDDGGCFISIKEKE